MVTTITKMSGLKSHLFKALFSQDKTRAACHRLIPSYCFSTASKDSSELDSEVQHELDTSSKYERRAQEVLDQIYEEVRAQRFNDIVVIQTKFNADPRYIILASAFNSRHLVRGTEMVNKQYKSTIKKSDQEFANVSISAEWNVLDFKSVVLHLFSKSCRDHFDIEQLWAVGAEFDHKCNFPDEPATGKAKIVSDDT